MKETSHAPVIEVADTVVAVFASYFVEFNTRTHLAQIPKSQSLVFSIGDDVTSVPLGGDISDTLGMSNEHTRRLLRSTQRPPIPLLPLNRSYRIKLQTTLPDFQVSVV